MQNQTKPKPLGASMAKVILVVAIIVSLGAVLGVVGWALTKPDYKQLDRIPTEKEILKPKENTKTSDSEEFDVFKFIPEESVRIQKVIEDIDDDNIEEVALYFITDDEKFLPSIKARFGKPNFMVLKKNNESDDYEIYWKYSFETGMSYYVTDKSNILIYDQKTDKPKIKFSIYKETSELHMFFYLDEEDDTFEKIKISNDDIYYKSSSIGDVISVEDTDGDGIAEIIENSERGFNYKWDDKNNTYNVINSCFKTNTKENPADIQRRIYFDDRYKYEIEYPVSASIIECKDNVVRIGELQIHPPSIVEKEKIENYKCKEGSETIYGHTPSQTLILNCAKIKSKNGFEIFKKSEKSPHNGEEMITYNLIKNSDKNFILVQIYAGGQATVDSRSSLDDIVSTFKFIEKEVGSFILEDHANRSIEIEGVIKEAESKFGAKFYVLCDIKNFFSYHYVYNSSAQRFEKAFKENCINLVKPGLSSKDVDEIKTTTESKLTNPINKTVKVSGDVFVYDTPCDQQTQVSCMRFIGINPQNIVLMEGDMKDWKTYRNEEYGFEFKYPADWFIYSDRIEAQTRIIQVASSLDKKIGEGTTFLGPVLDIRIPGESEEEGSLINMFGKSVRDTSWQSGMSMGLAISRQISILKNPDMIIYLGTGISGESIDLEKTILDQILSTFKFTEK